MATDHTEKATLFQILDAEAQTGIGLTESYAMNPPASVSGLCKSQYTSRDRPSTPDTGTFDSVLCQPCS